MSYLLDTNAWIVYLKGRDTAVRSRLEQTPRSEVKTCSIIWAVLLPGARKYEDPSKRQARIESLLNPLENFPFDLEAAIQYAIIRDGLEKKGMTIGLNDIFIASIARVHDLTVVTNNVNEFSRVPGLKVEDWTM